MAKIIIEATDADDLRITMQALLSGMYSGADEMGAPLTSDDVEAPKPRGRRAGRSSATAAALDTGNASLGTDASGDQAASPEASPGSASGLTATTAASPSEAAGAVTAEAVKVAMTKAMEATSPLIAQKALSDAGLPVRMSELTAEQYPKALEVLNALVTAV